MAGPAPAFVRQVKEPLQAPPRFDVVMCGGTLGIFLACALQLSGLRCGYIYEMIWRIDPHLPYLRSLWVKII